MPELPELKEEGSKGEDVNYNENIELVLAIFKEEFARERSRSDKLNTRVGTLLAVGVAILTITIPIFDIRYLLDFKIDDTRDLIIGAMPILIYVASKVFTIYSCKLLFDILEPREYKSIDYNHICSFLASDKESLYTELLKAYKIALDNNVRITDDRMCKCIKAIRFILYAIALAFIGYITTVFN